MGAHIDDRPPRWDALLASPAVRVRETLNEGMPEAQVLFDQRLYLADATTIHDVVRERGDGAASVLLIGHNPGMQDVLFALVAPTAENALFDEAATKFPTGALAVLELAIDDWGALAEGCGKLTHFTRPRDLDPSLGPPA
jgi:phosphohistidine phosphatase